MRKMFVVLLLGAGISPILGLATTNLVGTFKVNSSSCRACKNTSCEEVNCSKELASVVIQYLPAVVDPKKSEEICITESTTSEDMKTCWVSFLKSSGDTSWKAQLSVEESLIKYAETKAEFDDKTYSGWTIEPHGQNLFEFTKTHQESDSFSVKTETEFYSLSR